MAPTSFGFFPHGSFSPCCELGVLQTLPGLQAAGSVLGALSSARLLGRSLFAHYCQWL